MSHLPERKEKICLNCHAELIGRYCHRCGQQNTEPKESAWHLIVHFFYDLFHFDGKFFISVKYLLFKPGYLTEEYMKGRRASYLDPIRMYLFVSAMFFLIYLSFFYEGTMKTGRTEKEKEKPSLTTVARDALVSMDTLKYGGSDKKMALLNGDTITEREFNDFFPANVQAYDSFQSVLPPEERDKGLSRYFARKFIASSAYMKENREEARNRIRDKYYHSLPYVLFISLPAVAFLLRLLYIRRKQYFYVTHAIFTIHYFCFVFICLLVIYLLETLGYWGNMAGWVVRILAFIYLYKAMMRVYRQGWFKTLVKYLLFYCIGITFIMLVAFVFLARSVLYVA